jgi:hypothetical protein
MREAKLVWRLRLTGKEEIMKRYIKVVPLLLFVLMSGCAGSSQYMVKATPPTGSSPEKALVYFMRPSGMGFAINFQIWDSDHFVGLSQAKSYFAYECDPGKHLFIGIAENRVAIEADLVAGRSYYIGTNVRVGAWKARMDFTPVTQGSELWVKVEEFKESLNFIAAREEERSKWETAKKKEAQKITDYFSTGEGRAQVLRLNKEDGR